MDKINLDAIIDGCNNRISVFSKDSLVREDVKSCMKEAIHQALVLATEKADTTIEGCSDGYECWDVTVVDKQSILNVEKIIE